MHGTARRLNTLLLAYAEYLLHATSTDVWLARRRAGTKAAARDAAGAGAGAPGRTLVTGVAGTGYDELLVGSFSLPDGRSAALVHNQMTDSSRAAATATATLTFAGGLAGVRRVDPATGGEARLLSATVVLDAACAELYVSVHAAQSEAPRGRPAEWPRSQRALGREPTQTEARPF